MTNTNPPLDIVNLIEKNPITRLNASYQNKFIQKIKEKFTDAQQHLFIASFYCYLHYEKNDYVIDMENIWKWLGFARKDFCKKVLNKHFVKDIDYKIALLQLAERKNEGGYNKETILMNVNTFKKLCLKSNTKKADEIHDYFIKLEESFQEIINEESNELKLQLQSKEERLIESEKQKEIIREKTILDYFPDNTQCVYYGLIDNKTNNGESLIKFGNSNCLRERIEVHKTVFSNFRLVNAFKVENKLQIENEIKKHPILKILRRTITINNQNYTELLHINHYATSSTEPNNISFEEMDKMIERIITKTQFSPENYVKICEENENLKKQNKILKEILNRSRIQIPYDNPIVTTPTEKPIIPPHNEIITHRLVNHIMTPNTPILQDTIVLSDKDFNYEKNKLRRKTKSKDGFFHLGDKMYLKLTGTREEVWNDVAYHTNGGLTKADLTIGREGRIVSKVKCIYSKLVNHLGEYSKRVKN